MNDKRRKYGAAVFWPPELLDRDPTSTQRIEKELVNKLTDPIVKEAIKGECIVRFTETERQENFDLIESRKYVYIEDLVRCKDCRYYDYPFSDSPSAASRESDDAYPERWCCLLGMGGAFGSDDFCSHGERKTAESE